MTMAHERARALRFGWKWAKPHAAYQARAAHGPGLVARRAPDKKP